MQIILNFKKRHFLILGLIIAIPFLFIAITNILAVGLDGQFHTADELYINSNIDMNGKNITSMGGIQIIDGTEGMGKILTSDVSGTANWQAVGGSVPSGAVMSFNLASCPTGWTELVAARGRYIVGRPSGGTLAGTTGTALSNLENRQTGQHTHGITGVWGNWYSNSGNYLGIPGAQYTTASAHGTNGVAGGAVAGTNAPYIQLLTCQKS